MRDMKTIVAKNILFYRKLNKLSQKALADMIGVKHNTISSWENCTNAVDIDSLFKICDALNVSINTMTDTDNTTNGGSITFSEQKLLEAYRNHPEMQQAINKMLDITDNAEQPKPPVPTISSFDAAIDVTDVVMAQIKTYQN